MSSQQNQILSCAKCDKNTSSPLILECFHIICHECAYTKFNIEKVNKQEFYRVTCPKCKQLTFFSKNFQDKLKMSKIQAGEVSSPEKRENPKWNQNPKLDWGRGSPQTHTSRSKSPNTSNRADKSPIRKQLISPQKIKTNKEQSSPISKKNFNNPAFLKTVQKQMKGALQCPVHQTDYGLFCVDSKQLACIDCVFGRGEHKNQHIVSLKASVGFLQDELKSFKVDASNYYRVVDDSIKQCHQNQKYLLSAWEFQRDIIQKEYSKLQQELRLREQMINEQIRDFFEENLQSNQAKLDNLECVKKYLVESKEYDTLATDMSTEESSCYFYSLSVMLQDTFQKYKVEPNSVTSDDIICIDFTNKKKTFKEAEKFCQIIKPKKMLKPMASPGTKLDQIENQVLTLEEMHSNQIKNYFYVNTLLDQFKESRILNENMKQKETFKVLPDLQGKLTKLLYSMQDDSPSSAIFHKKCDNQGPCIVLIEANNNVFGFYSPFSFTSENKYQSSADTTIFSIVNTFGYRPLKFEIKSDKNYIAIYQSSENPTLGSTMQEKQDLQINFDTPQLSCSYLGYAYGYDIEQDFLANASTNWDVKEIEVFQIQDQNNHN